MRRTLALTARSTDMGNTMSIDMGNTFTLIAPDLRGHVKSTFGNSATAGVCEVGFEGPTKHVAFVSDVRIEPQERPCGMPGDWAPTRTMGSANWSSKPRFPSALSLSPTIPSSRFAGGTSAAASRQERKEQTTQSVTHVLAQSVTHVLSRFPPRPSPR